MSTPAIRAIFSYPCRCLCFGISQITRSTPCRLMILHFSQRFLIEARTLTSYPLLSEPVSDASALQVIRRKLDQDAVARQHLDEVEPDLAGDVGEHLVPVRQLHFEHRVGQRLLDDALYLNRVFLGHTLPFRQPISSYESTKSISRWLTKPLILSESGQHLRAVLRDCSCVLEVRRQTAVDRRHGPDLVELPRVPV